MTLIILGILTTVILIALNPVAQIQKGEDAQRGQDLKQLQTALDTYYNDTGCYPQSLPDSGTAWVGSNGTVYMEKVPGDPSLGGSANYAYEPDTVDSSCPQWNVLYAKVVKTSNFSTACPLKQLGSGSSSCFPSNNPSGYNYCVISGEVKCNITLSFTPVPSGPSESSGGGGGAPAGGGGGTPTGSPGAGGGGGAGGGNPTPTPPGCYCHDARYAPQIPGNPGTYCEDEGPGNGSYCIRDGGNGNTCFVPCQP